MSGQITCQAEECQRDATSHAGTLRVCLLHYKRWKRHGDVNVQGRRYSPPNPDKADCALSDCAERVDGASEWCKLHGSRVRRHGDPSVVIAPSDRATPTGMQNGAWSGDDIGYSGMHSRVRRQRGRARDHACIDCGGPASQWSYDRRDENARASAFGPYSLDVAHYEPRCVRCHKEFDLTAIARAAA
ncbi:hypothetical protein [Microbacterium sp. K24]|uniref:hypothetical protein n=1 Tax=Microbacterium sp. K24 TaxID=2305446 RepID=UPI00109CF4A4|nr:hypothetical protein [Microbacterium sp. K24]